MVDPQGGNPTEGHTMTTPQPSASQNGPEGLQPPPPPFPGAPTGPKRPTVTSKQVRLLTSKPFIGVAALVAGMVLGGVATSGDNKTQPIAMPTATVTVTVPSVGETLAPTGSEAATEEPAETPAPPSTPVKKEYKSLSSRTFKLLVKDPDSYIGKTYVVYGEITQFDAATGTDTFRADTGPKKLRISYGYVDYPQNSFLSGTDSQLKKLVEGDCFKAKVTVLGSYSYDTQAGGNTTVPLFQVDSVSVYGSTS